MVPTPTTSETMGKYNLLKKFAGTGWLKKRQVPEEIGNLLISFFLITVWGHMRHSVSDIYTWDKVPRSSQVPAIINFVFNPRVDNLNIRYSQHLLVENDFYKFPRCTPLLPGNNCNGAWINNNWEVVNW